MNTFDILKQACEYYGMRPGDVIFGPSSAELRRQIASAIHGRELSKSDKLCQFGRLRSSLLELAKIDRIPGLCRAEQDRFLAHFVATGSLSVNDHHPIIAGA